VSHVGRSAQSIDSLFIKNKSSQVAFNKKAMTLHQKCWIKNM